MLSSIHHGRVAELIPIVRVSSIFKKDIDGFHGTPQRGPGHGFADNGLLGPYSIFDENVMTGKLQVAVAIAIANEVFP